MRIRSDSNGTKADLNPGDMIELGYKPNYGKRRMAAYVYLTATLSGLSDLVSRQSRTESGRGLRQDEATTQVWPANVRFGSILLQKSVARTWCAAINSRKRSP